MERVSRACESIRLALGAYALGALDGAERDQVEGHLRGCETCRAELEAFAGLPSLLGRVRSDEAIAGAAEGRPEAGALVGAPPLAPAIRGWAGAPGGLLERTLTELRRRRRRARLRSRVAAAAAGVVVLASAGVAAGLAVSLRPAPALPVAARMAATDASTGVSASADVYAESWGSSISLQVKGVERGQECQLVVVAWDGTQEVAGSWAVGYTGQVNVEGASGMDPGQIGWLRVATTQGGVLVSLSMAGATKG